MVNEFEWNRMIAGELYTPAKVGSEAWAKVHKAQKEFNESEDHKHWQKEYDEYIQ